MTEATVPCFPLSSRARPEAVDFLQGPFTPAAAATAGLGRAGLERLVRSGSVHRLLRGVYLDADLAVTPEVRAAALRLVIGRRQTVVGRTAAWLHGCAADGLLVGLDPARGIPIELRERGHRLPAATIITVDGLRCVTASFAAADLARRLEPGPALAALDALLRCGAVDHAALRAELVRSTTDGLVREIAARSDGRADGPAESVLRLHWLDARLPTPSPGLVIAGARTCLALPTHRFGVVIAGRTAPTARRRWQERGWEILSLAADQVLGTDPSLVRAHLEREFHQHLLREAGASAL